MLALKQQLQTGYLRPVIHANPAKPAALALGLGLSPQIISVLLLVVPSCEPASYADLADIA